ncbi:MAG TPA: SpoVA/SpoVAEb family sporulation membrane protein [Bacilli bacterium]|nr:SpoVA/SpoVAEb family sporulation membrane protein [Bacilli bacterium]
MEKKKYQEIVKRHVAKENKKKNALVAFLIGGLLGAFGNLLIEFYSYVFDISSADAGIYMIITLVFMACLFTALGFFDNFVKFGRMGIIIPITGFAHSMQSATLDYKNEGLVLGFGSNMFKLAGTVILYGVTSAYFFGLIRLIITGGV